MRFAARNDMQPFWMVLADNSNVTNVRHSGPAVAKAEARRLAALNKGTKFFVLQCVGVAVVADPVQWTDIDGDQIPF